MEEIKCAVYTRKSTDEGLEKEFNTLEAQREAGVSAHTISNGITAKLYGLAVIFYSGYSSTTSAI